MVHQTSTSVEGKCEGHANGIKKDTVELIEFSVTLKLNLKPFSTSQISLYVFHQMQNKKFSSLLKTSPQESLEFLQNEFTLNSCENDLCLE